MHANKNINLWFISIIPWTDQGIIDPTGTETFAKKLELAKIIAEAKVDARFMQCVHCVFSVCL